MTNIQTTYTTIIHSIREHTGLSLVEYAVCDTIDKLSNRDGHKYCTMNQQDIGIPIGVDERTVRRAMDKLVQLGYIEGGKGRKRTTEKWTKCPIGTDRIGQNVPLQQDKLSKEQDKMSSLYNNNIYNNRSVPLQEQKQVDTSPTLPYSMGKTPVQRLTKLYTTLLREKVGIAPVISYPMVGAIFKRLLRDMKEIQLATLVMAHMNYNPTQSWGDKFLQKRLVEQLFPITLLPLSIYTYKVYLLKEKELDIDGDAEALRDVVYKLLEKLNQ